jgi:LacI family transcriptional regulator
VSRNRTISQNRSMFKVGVSLRSGLAYTTRILHGIVDFARRSGNWQIEVDSDFHFGQRPARLNDAWDGHGVILLGGENEVDAAAIFRNRKLAVVNCTGWWNRFSGAPAVFWDDEKVAAMAADHLLSLGLKNFAYFGPKHFPPSHARARAFAQKIRDAGHSCTLCEWQPEEIEEVAIWTAPVWRRAAHLFRQQIAKLPPGVGIFANNDITASLVIQVGAEMQRSCPGDLVVVGFWNDRVICESTHPSLSSIDVDAAALGFQAAEMLHRMMCERGYRPAKITFVGACDLVTRESSDYLCFEDELIALALRYIRKHAPSRNLSVDEVAATVPMSRSSFTSRFRAATGASAKAEILRVRLEHAKWMLANTEATVTQIGDAMGFESSQDLARLFRTKMGLSPTEFRQRIPCSL